MTDGNPQRTYGLIEDLRAEVDFEIDDVIANIVHNLPDEYFQSLTREDQLTHLKALLAISICNLKTELMLRSEDERHVALVARKNYPGLLAKIISRLPTDLPLVGAKVFTSKTHDFIIDLFEFESPASDQQTTTDHLIDTEHIVSTVSNLTGVPNNKIAEFVSYYHPASRILQSADDVHDHYLAFEQARTSDSVAVRWGESSNPDLMKLTVSAKQVKSRELFQKIAEFLGTQSLDVEQAFLDDFYPADQDHIAVLSFLIFGKLNPATANSSITEQLTNFITQS